MRTTRRLVAAAIAAAALLPAAAWADADPASDYLPGFDSYLPYGNTVAKPTQGQLNRLLAIARARGHPYKVAVIATPTDLGAVTALFDKPQPYARFLYREIKPLIQGADATLVVVMPDGVGMMGKDATATGREVAARIKPGASATPTALTTAAVGTVEKIAAANGHALPRVRPSAGAATGAGGHGHRVFLGLLGAVLLAGVGAALLLRARALQRDVSAS